MSESDELGWKQFDKLGEELQEAAISAIEEVLADKANTVYRQMLNTTPVKTGQTVQSIKIEKIDEKGRGGSEKIGYRVYYDGYRLLSNGNDGSANQVIANSLNRGFVLPNFTIVAPRYFIDKAVATLRGTDDEIDEKFRKACEKIKVG